MQIKKLFLASSSELREDRQEFEIFLYRKNKEWIKQGVSLELVVWEDFLDAMSQTRLQDEYDKAVRDSDIFVMLFHTKVGKYTEEEFETAFAHFKANSKPLIFTYFKDDEVSLGSINEDDMMSLWAFKKKLAALGHFTTVYKNTDDLKFQFNQQLDKLAADGFIELKTDRAAASAASRPPSSAAMPTFLYGGWVLRNAIDDEGNNWSNSVLKFSSQQPAPEGLALRGTFTWRLNDMLVGTEEVTGIYIAATREVILEGEEVSAPERLAVVSYYALLAPNGRELIEGRWGSTAKLREAGAPGRWEASR